MSHIVQQIKNPELLNDNILHVVACVSNPARWHSRLRLARDFMAHMALTPNIKFYMVETAYGDRQHELTSSTNPQHLQLRTNSEIWIKESMINLGVRYLLPKDWRYLAWIDADVEFRNPNWVQEALHELQHFEVIQPWQSCSDLGFHGNIVNSYQSYGTLRQAGVRIQKWKGEPYPYGHSGYAWACTRAFWERVGGLMDFCPLGSADHHMAFAMTGETKSTVHGKMSKSFFRRCYEWQERAIAACRTDVGASVGRIEHNFHGPKAFRYYRERWQILVDHGYDPDKHLMHDAQGLIQIVNNDALEVAIRKYNRARREDSIDE